MWILQRHCLVKHCKHSLESCKILYMYLHDTWSTSQVNMSIYSLHGRMEMRCLSSKTLPQNKSSSRSSCFRKFTRRLWKRYTAKAELILNWFWRIPTKRLRQMKMTKLLLMTKSRLLILPELPWWEIIDNSRRFTKSKDTCSSSMSLSSQQWRHLIHFKCWWMLHRQSMWDYCWSS